MSQGFGSLPRAPVVLLEQLGAQPVAEGNQWRRQDFMKDPRGS